MAQFDVHPFGPGSLYVVDIQSDFLKHLSTRAVIPVTPYQKSKPEYVSTLKPRVKIKGKDYVLLTTEIGYLKKSHLKPAIANIESQRTTIIQAVDFLIQGF